MPSPLPSLQLAFESQTGLCDLLDDLLLSFPRHVDRQACLELSRIILPLLKRAHSIEQARLFPELLGVQEDGRSIVAHLSLEQLEDQCVAEEVQLELLQLGQGEPILEPELTRSVLGGFSRGIRQRLNRERNALDSVRSLVYRTILAPAQ